MWPISGAALLTLLVSSACDPYRGAIVDYFRPLTVENTLPVDVTVNVLSTCCPKRLDPGQRYTNAVPVREDGLTLSGTVRVAATDPNGAPIYCRIWTQVALDEAGWTIPIDNTGLRC